MGRQTTTNEYAAVKNEKKIYINIFTNRKEGRSSREDGPGLFMLWTWNARHVAQETRWGVVERYKRKRTTTTTTNRKCKTKEEDEREFPKLIERLHW